MDDSLVRALRPGSRTVVCHPDKLEFVLDLARRGFRLMLVHDAPDFIQELRASLRQTGLSSQLMGSTLVAVNVVPSLARGFYELVLLCPRSRLNPPDMKFALGVGGLLVQPSPQGEVQLAGFQPVELPAGFVGGRAL